MRMVSCGPTIADLGDLVHGADRHREPGAGRVDLGERR